jgi:hypothetical protein
VRTSVIALAVVGTVAVVVASVLAFLQWQQAREEAALRDEAEDVAASFLSAWSDDDTAAMADLVGGDPGAFIDAHEEAVAGLDADRWEFEHGSAALTAERGARVPFSTQVGVPGVGEWVYDSRLDLLLEGDGDERTWRIDWSRGSVHPELGDDEVLGVDRRWPDRQPILDRSGDPLEDAGASLGLLIGEVEEADEEMLAEVGEHYLVGDPIGTGGLQRAFESRLAGAPTAEIHTATLDGEPVEVLHTVDGEEGQAVRTTIHPAVQSAAEAVAAGAPTAIVVSDPATGQLLAVVSHPAGDWNRAMAARYPPGSTFKVVTAAALLRDGMEPDDPIDCPETRDVGGWTFRNFEDMELGGIDLRTATYESCNTAYVRMAADLDDDVFHATAEDFGFNASVDLPVSARGGVFPDYENDAVKAAAGFGQGQVESSPMHLASVAAAVADGAWRHPVLVLEPGQGDAETRDVSDVAPTLREFMELVVSRGTAVDSGLPSDVIGKTGTAEWGTRDEDGELPTHAWFMGYAPWEDPEGEVERIAFAVIVEGGESGGRVAAPLTARFLEQLRG